MIRSAGSVRRLARRVLFGPRADGEIVGALVQQRLDEELELRPLADAMTDEEARVHFGEEELVEAKHLRWVIRFFHAWRVRTLRERIGESLTRAQILDVGDTDGLLLKHLGKTGIGCNLSPATIRNIESNGIEARLGDAHCLPFEDDAFDVVFCFETLEHVENPHNVLVELARVCRPHGQVFISIP
ncbi:MAG: class I SAM-dependent methyltransferase, partial [Gemmatimonadetes bacterium]|nr:class I SAM-dependent methyltransferase [Gemmatimonadota bacterium]